MAGGLPHLSGLPHLHGAPPFHVNRPIDLPWKNQWWTRHRHLEAKLTRFDDFTKGRIKIQQIQIICQSGFLSSPRIPTLLPNRFIPYPSPILQWREQQIVSNLLCRWQCQTKHSPEMVWTLHRDVPWRESLQNKTRRSKLYLTLQGRRNTTDPPTPSPPPTERHISSLLNFPKHYVAHVKLRARLHGSRKNFERSKTCTDPPFVYSGSAEFARFRVNGLHR